MARPKATFEKKARRKLVELVSLCAVEVQEKGLVINGKLNPAAVIQQKASDMFLKLLKCRKR
jgi:hypothetical protein